MLKHSFGSTKKQNRSYHPYSRTEYEKHDRIKIYNISVPHIFDMIYNIVKYFSKMINLRKTSIGHDIHVPNHEVIIQKSYYTTSQISVEEIYLTLVCSIRILRKILMHESNYPKSTEEIQLLVAAIVFASWGLHSDEPLTESEFSIHATNFKSKQELAKMWTELLPYINEKTCPMTYPEEIYLNKNFHNEEFIGNEYINIAKKFGENVVFIAKNTVRLLLDPQKNEIMHKKYTNKAQLYKTVYDKKGMIVSHDKIDEEMIKQPKMLSDLDSVDKPIYNKNYRKPESIASARTLLRDKPIDDFKLTLTSKRDSKILNNDNDNDNDNNDNNITITESSSWIMPSGSPVRFGTTLKSDETFLLDDFDEDVLEDL